MSIVYDALKKIEKERVVNFGSDLFKKDVFLHNEKNIYKKIAFFFVILILFLLSLFFIGKHFFEKSHVTLNLAHQEVAVSSPVMPEENNAQSIKKEIPVLEEKEDLHVSQEVTLIEDEEKDIELQPSSVDAQFDELYDQLARHQLDEVNARLASYKADAQYLPVIEKLSTALLMPQNASILVAFLSPIVEENPNNTLLRQNLASAYYLEGQYSNAIRVLIVSSPEEKYRLSYYDLLASAYMRTKQYDLAVPLYEMLKQQAPENPNFLLALGIIYQSKGKWLLSQTYYKKALQVAPEGWASYSFSTTQLQRIGSLG